MITNDKQILLLTSMDSRVLAGTASRRCERVNNRDSHAHKNKRVGSTILFTIINLKSENFWEILKKYAGGDDKL